MTWKNECYDDFSYAQTRKGHISVKAFHHIREI